MDYARRTPADALAKPDLHATIAELFTMVAIYREMTGLLLDEIYRLREEQARRT